jgi:hypothetical protein
MSSDQASKKALLQHRNAQLVYFRQLREKGLVAPESHFEFLDLVQENELLDKIAVLLRSLPETVFGNLEAASKPAIEWLSARNGEVICFVRDVGVLVGEAKFFLQQFPYFEPLMNEHLLFSTRSLNSGFRCLEDEHRYYVAIW